MQHVVTSELISTGNELTGSNMEHFAMTEILEQPIIQIHWYNANNISYLKQGRRW